MTAQQPRYSPKEVAESLCVSESSVKRWCDRGAIATVRTVGGHRRITLEALQQFLSSSERRLIHPEILGLPMLPAARQLSISGGDSPQQQAFRQALAAGQESQCRDILRGLIGKGHSASQAADGLITDAMVAFGEAWGCNELAVYQERRGCDISLRLINELRRDLPPASDDAPVAIGGTPEGDPYQLPTALVELTLRELGWQATSLGCNLPLDSILQAAHDCKPQLIWLSVSAIAETPEFITQQNWLAGSLGETIPLLVGGRALTDHVRPKLRYTAHCDQLRHLADLSAMLRHRAGSADAF